MGWPGHEMRNAPGPSSRASSMAEQLSTPRRRTASHLEAELRQKIAERTASGGELGPLTPSDCDVSSYPGFIVQAARLSNSEFWMLATGKTKLAAIELWMFAWRQVPAASLPANPKLLSRITGLPARQIAQILESGDLHLTPFHGFVRCSDGRLYHPVLASDALRAWNTSQAREKAANERHQRAAFSDGVGRALRLPTGTSVENRRNGRYNEEDY